LLLYTLVHVQWELSRRVLEAELKTRRQEAEQAAREEQIRAVETMER
jgi:hypothetical protein